MQAGDDFFQILHVKRQSAGGTGHCKHEDAAASCGRAPRSNLLRPVHTAECNTAGSELGAVNHCYCALRKHPPALQFMAQPMAAGACQPTMPKLGTGGGELPGGMHLCTGQIGVTCTPLPV